MRWYEWALLPVTIPLVFAVLIVLIVVMFILGGIEQAYLFITENV